MRTRMGGESTTRDAVPREPSGRLLAEVSNAIVVIYKDCYGKGPTKARTIVDEDMLVCVLEGGFQAGERTLRDAGRSEIVTENREAFQQVLRERFVSTVEELTGRKVRAFVSGVDTETEVSTELFLFEPAVELGDEHEAVHAWADQTKRRTRELREEQVALREEHARLRRSPS